MTTELPDSSTTSADGGLAVFAALKPRLFAMAYRMLGTRADADDVVQDAWLRWHGADKAALQSAEAWLVTVVTRLAIDRLRSAKVERAAYQGNWLPEPLVEAEESQTPESLAELASDVSMAFMLVLERLQPEERAAFLLRQAFDRDYDEIALLLGKSEAACRQIVHRASLRVQQDRPRFEVPKDTHRRLLEKFVAAARSGERAAIEALLGDDVQAISDGGGRVSASPKVLRGVHRIANMYVAVLNKYPGQVVYRFVQINGERGLLRYVSGELESAQSFVTDGERIVSIHMMRNPDKLAGIPSTP
ncbi:RNA polymerase sigma-70 factor [soil metagenome]